MVYGSGAKRQSGIRATRSEGRQEQEWKRDSRGYKALRCWGARGRLQECLKGLTSLEFCEWMWILHGAVAQSQCPSLPPKVQSLASTSTLRFLYSRELPGLLGLVTLRDGV